ncbi:hypothetical protein ACHAWF_004133 [Thalassiosira exigua]
MSSPRPPPPSSPPPRPSHLCKIAVVGDASSGKTSLVHKFIHRVHAYEDGNKKCSEDNIGDADTNGAASATSNSLGTASLEGLAPTLAEYHKKDVTIWRKHDNKDDRGELKERPVCIRVQLWDMNMHNYCNSSRSEQDSNLVHSTPSDLRSPVNITDNMNTDPLRPLFKRISGIIIACGCPLPPTSFSISSHASHASQTSNTSCSEWPELDLLEEKIQRWNKFLTDHNTYEDQRPSIFVLLTCADLVLAGYSPREWVRLSNKMDNIRDECCFESWKICTCKGRTGFSIERECLQIRQSTLLQRIIHQQELILDDTQDAVESTFVEVILASLFGTKDRQRHLI